MVQSTLTELHGLIATYQMPQSAKEIVLSSKLMVLCGVTAAGKNTISNYLVMHDNFEAVVSHTTREPRDNKGVQERNGKEYWFVNDEQMLLLVKQRAFVEVKAVHGDTCYGTSIAAIQDVLDNKKQPVMEIDIQGALELTQAVPDLRPIFILPPSYDVWMERLGTRGFMSDGEKERRFRSASMEIQTALEHSSFEIVVNHEVEDTARALLNGMAQGPTEQADARKLAEELLDYMR